MTVAENVKHARQAERQAEREAKLAAAAETRVGQPLREPGLLLPPGVARLAQGTPLREALKAIAEPRQRAPRYFASGRARFRVRSL
jgi:hypothetical protein